MLRCGDEKIPESWNDPGMPCVPRICWLTLFHGMALTVSGRSSDSRINHLPRLPGLRPVAYGGICTRLQRRARPRIARGSLFSFQPPEGSGKAPETGPHVTNREEGKQLIFPHGGGLQRLCCRQRRKRACKRYCAAWCRDNRAVHRLRGARLPPAAPRAATTITVFFLPHGV